MSGKYSLEELKENRKKWIDALESGEYKQGKCLLKRDDAYCCLGICTLLYANENPDYKPDWGRTHLDTEVREWVGLSTIGGKFEIGHTDNYLVNLNDNGKTFQEIAAVIKSEPPGLFSNPSA